MTLPARVLIVAGEASGDLYGSLVMRAAAARPSPSEPPLLFTGIGGPSMRSAGLPDLIGAEGLGVTGFLEVLGSAAHIWRAYRRVCSLVASATERPDLVLLIDYPDFNLRVAKHAHRAGIPVLYFISPQVWAWRKGRVGQIAGVVDRMLVILPFEEEIYRRAGVPVEFVGHPLLDIVRPELTRRQALAPLGLEPDRRTVALLPGSRRNELHALLPVLVEAARLLRKEFRDLQFVVPVAPTITDAEVDRYLGRSGLRGPDTERGESMTGWAWARDHRYDVIAACDAAVVASGTATLETALLGVPMVIVYRVNPLTYALARIVSRVPHIGMPNLIAGQRIAPELVQNECRPERVAAEIRRILTEPQVADSMRRSWSGVRSRLGRPGAIERVAAAAWDMIEARRSPRVD
ncbi:MAG TPA: lipid-A-disaccharide synthase [Candidatus Binatia bacterium]|nr:lipid-A-disaccharide synthase [Candidatus Binatia bacterium]